MITFTIYSILQYSIVVFKGLRQIIFNKITQFYFHLHYFLMQNYLITSLLSAWYSLVIVGMFYLPSAFIEVFVPGYQNICIEQ